MKMSMRAVATGLAAIPLAKEGRSRELLKRVSLVMVVVALVSWSAGSACGSGTVYNDEGSYLAAAPYCTMESFEGSPVQNNLILSSITVPDFTVTTVTMMGVYNGPTGWGGHATHGVNFVAISSSAEELDFSMNDPVKAWGINITDWGDWGSGTLTFQNNLQDVYRMAFSPRDDDNEFFWGFVGDQPFNRALLTNSIVGEGYSFDELYYGIPEPATLALVTLGAGLLVRKRRTRRFD